MQYIAYISLLMVGIGILFIATSYLISAVAGAQFVRTPPELFPKILELAGLSPGEEFIELGSGDGRLLGYVVKRCGAHAIGIELSPYLVLRTKIRYQRPDVQVRMQSIFAADLSDTNCVYCYLLPNMMRRLALKFRRELKPGTRVISYAFPIPDKTPDRTIPRTDRISALYLYRY